MKTWMRRTLWGAGLLLGLPFLLFLLWFLVNLRDVPAQPWPEALALPRNTLAPEHNLLVALEAAPAPDKDFGLSLNPCASPDCLADWRAGLDKQAEPRARSAAFGAACETLTAQADLRFQDAMPETMRVGWLFPALTHVSRCHQWLLGRALTAAMGGEAAEPMRWLAQADRLDRAVLEGSRSLIAQMIGASMWGRKLSLLQGVALLQPSLSADLPALAQLDARHMLVRQHEWIRVEASVNRSAIDELTQAGCDARLLSGEVQRAWACFTAQGMQPEYSKQLFARRWQDAQVVLAQADTLPAALPALRQALMQVPEGWWPRLRHTVPLILDEVAGPVYPGYFERFGDLQLAAEATRLWLLDARAPLPERASAALRERLKPDPQGGWRLTPWTSDSSGRMPLHWAAPA